jgi:chemosensory pili system protein ChpA (sensor histidine kinase/response regulator)
MAHVLVVDDSDLLRSSMSRALRRHGHRVETAENGAVALRLLAVDPLPDVIVLDLTMPEMNGYEFRAAQCADPRLAGIPVVVASGEAPEQPTGVLAGTLLIAKPTTGDALSEAITWALCGSPWI